jgi:hypothetical protein
VPQVGQIFVFFLSVSGLIGRELYHRKIRQI